MADTARAMGATLIGVQKLLGKHLNFSSQFVEPLFGPHAIINYINTARPYLM